MSWQAPVVGRPASGGRPAFAEPLHVGRPNVGDRRRLHRRLDEILDRRWLTNGGPLVEEFENRVAEQAGVRHCVAVCNATLGLQIAASALGLAGEVLVPAYTFVATCHALQWNGLEPVFCDVDPLTHTLDVRRATEQVTDRTAAVVGVHLWGGMCDVRALEAFARERGLPLLFDAAHAFGVENEAGAVGRFGKAEVFSFHATKFVNAFEGGAVVTDDDGLAAQMRLERNFGFADYDTVVALGTNAKMSEMSAAMGLTSLEAIEEILRRNQENALAYRAGLHELPGVRLFRAASGVRSNDQYVVIEVDASLAGRSRDDVMAYLHSHNVLARRYFYPGCHRMEPYRSRVHRPTPHLPVTEHLCSDVLVLPTGTAVTPDDVAIVCELIRKALR